MISTALVTLIYLTVPVIAPPRPFEPRTFLGHALMFERAMSHTVAAFPAFPFAVTKKPSSRAPPSYPGDAVLAGDRTIAKP